MGSGIRRRADLVGIRPALRLLAVMGLLLLPWSGAVTAGPPKPAVVALLGSASDGGRLAAAQAAAEVSAAGIAKKGPLEGGVAVHVFDDGGTEAGFKKALKALRSKRPVAVLALPSADLEEAYWKAARKVRVPWVTLTGRSPNRIYAPEYLVHLGPTPVGQAIVAADGVIAPLAARRVGVVHEPTKRGIAMAAAFGRNLSARVTLAGARSWEPDADASSLASLKAFEAEWIYVAMAGASLHHFVKTLAASDWRPKLFFADGAKDASLLEVADGALEECVFLDGPDPEMQGRRGERLLDALDGANKPFEAISPRAAEAMRRVLAAIEAAESTKLKPVLEAFAPHDPKPGVLGKLAFARSGEVHMYGYTWWRVRKGMYDPWPEGLLPTPGCGPPIGFGRPRTARMNDKGKLGYLTWGGGDKRTIDQDLLEIGLSTGGKDKELDEMVRQEVLGRAIRIANRLFRREADGTPVSGWSWGMSFTTTKPEEDLKHNRIWLAVCAGDHEAAGGQAFGTWVAVYTTFLKRTMYIDRKLDPPLSAKDRRLVDGTYRWGEDRAANFRADKIRCLMDGFASAMGLTLSHEYGHLCGCEHDTEHPTSIMNVVAGAGASWEDAVWIPKHQKKVTKTLGIEPLPPREKKRSK